MLKGAGGNGKAQTPPPAVEPAGEPAAEPETRLERPATVVLVVTGWRGAPVVGAKVTVEDDTRAVAAHDGGVGRESTDEHGVVRVAGLDRPQITISVTAEGHEEHSVTVYWLTEGEEREQRVALRATATLDGRVVREADRAPIAGAKVLLRSVPVVDLHRSEEWGEYFEDVDPVRTDADGRFRFPNLRIATDYSVWVEAPGYERGERGVLLVTPHATPNATPEVELALRPSGRLRARVLDHLERPVPEVWVVLVPDEVASSLPPRRHRTGTLRELEFVIDDLPVAPCDAPAEGHRAPKGDPFEAALHDPWRGLLCGSWFTQETPPVYSAQTDASGIAVLEGLGVGRTFRVDLSPRGYMFDRSPWIPSPDVQALRVTATVAAPDPEVTLRVLAPAALRVRGVDAHGSRLEGELQAVWNGEELHATQDVPDECVFAGLEPGRGTLEVRVAGYAAGRTALVLVAGAETLAEVPLVKVPPLRGRVVDEHGVPYTRGSVWVGGAFPESVHIDAEGRFELSGLAPPSVRLSAETMDAAAPARVDVPLPDDDIVLTLPRGPRGVVVATMPIRPPRTDDEEGDLEVCLRPAAEVEGWQPSALLSSGCRTSEEVVDGRITWAVTPGRYLLACRYRGCELWRRTVEVREGATLDLGLLTPPAPQLVRGVVVLPDGSPAPWASVRLEGYDVVQADMSGGFSLAHGPRVACRALVGGGTYVALEQVVEPAAPGGVLRLRASLGAVLEGRVVGERGPEPLTLAVLPVDKGARPPRTPPRIDSAGRFHLALPEGRYRVELQRTGAVLDAAEVTLAEEGAASLTLRAQR
jgi:hypothetical protein